MIALNVDKIAAMEQMTARELREKYCELFGEGSRSGNKVWLIKRIAWRLQAQAEGGLSERARRRAEELANDADLRLQAPRPFRKREPRPTRRALARDSAAHDGRVPLSGTVITRLYKGRTLRVHVLEDGFEHEGEVYRSLSAVARAITGSHTNGFLFFRLEKKGART